MVASAAVVVAANKRMLADYPIDRATLRHVKEIGKGQFGKVYLSVQTQSERSGWSGQSGFRHCRRAVKVVADGDAANDAAFLAETAIQAPLDHPNVLRLMGVSMEKRPWLAVLELAEYGDVRSFLRTLKGKDFELRDSEKVHLAAQVAYGLEYLHSERIVHRDIAARNILLAGYSTAKIGDFGLARNYDSHEDTWLMAERECLSVQWAPVEVFQPGKKYFSEKTDVWSFGVFMWELFTYGATPFADIAATRVPKALAAGVRLPAPAQCPEGLYALMRTCWQADAHARETFGALKEILLKERAKITQGDGYQTVRDFAGVFKAHLCKEQKAAAAADREVHAHAHAHAAFGGADSAPQPPRVLSRDHSSSSLRSHGEESIVFGFHNDIDDMHNLALHCAARGGDEPLHFGFGERRSSDAGHAASTASSPVPREDSLCNPAADSAFAYERFTSAGGNGNGNGGRAAGEGEGQDEGGEADDDEEFHGFRRARRYSERDSPSNTPTRNMASARSTTAWEAPDHHTPPRGTDGGDGSGWDSESGSGSGSGSDSDGDVNHACARTHGLLRSSSSSSSVGSGTSATSTPDGALRLGTCASCRNGLAPGDWYHHRALNTGVCHRCFHLGYADQRESFFWVSTTEDIIRALSSKPGATGFKTQPTPPPVTPVGTPTTTTPSKKLSATKRTKMSRSRRRNVAALTPDADRKRASAALPQHLILSQPGAFGGLRMVSNPFIATSSDLVPSPTLAYAMNDTKMNRGMRGMRGSVHVA